MNQSRINIPISPSQNHFKPKKNLIMATNLSKSLINPPPPSRATSNHLSSLPPSVYLPPKRRSLISIFVIRNSNSGINNNGPVDHAIEMKKRIESKSSNGGNHSKDLPTSLPKPLTSAQLSNLASGGAPLRVAYQGVRGAYSESAAEKAYPNCEAVPCEQFDTAFEAVEKWIVDRAVLPIENSLGGSIHRNYDLLLRHRLNIVGEVKLAISHCLLANHGVKIEDLKRVLSHPQALAQCENTLTKLGLVREAADDTAGAAKHVAFSKLRDTGAVASSRAAMFYDLNVLAEDIQDDSDNITRFLMLARDPIIPGTDKPFKTSIVFSLEEGPGALFKGLAVFAMRSINLTKIESRPLQKHTLSALDGNVNGFTEQFPYLFYVDFEASMAEPKAQNALGHLREFATFLRVLGSYPADNTTP